MLIAGLTGGMACGKTFVAETFRELGAHVVEADSIGRDVMKPGGAVYDEVVREFGREFLDAAGGIDRAKLARRVFSDPAALARLNAIVHPAVRERAMREFREIGEQNPHALIVYAAAILIETGTARDFDKLILVTCTREQQIERALARGGITESEVIARLERQLPLQKKQEFADYIIDTGGTKEETLRQTKMVYSDLRKLA